jgi:hypothetical protein
MGFNSAFKGLMVSAYSADMIVNIFHNNG